MSHYAIFDKEGCVAFFDQAASPRDALARLQADDESYRTDPPRVHELSEEETDLLRDWITDGQQTHRWPFDWRGSLR